MDTQRLEKIARRMVGRQIEIKVGKGAYTDGATVTLPDFCAQWPALPITALKDMEEFVTGHEAGHIVELDKIALKTGKPSVSSEEFYQQFADPLSPGTDSKKFVRYLLNMVEDQLVDCHSAKAVGQDKGERVNRFFVWNRQGGRRPSMAEFESQGASGKCAAFVEALFQLSVYGELVESFFSAPLATAAEAAAKAITAFSQGSLSRTQALQRVLDALRQYCPPPWKMPAQYQPPKGEGAGQGGNPSPQSGQGNGQGQGQGQGQGEGDGKAGDGQSGEGQGQGQGTGESDGGKAEGQGQGQADGKSGESDKSPGDSQNADDSSSDDSEGEGSAQAEESEGEDDPEMGQESDGGGQGSPSKSNSRGAGAGEQAGPPQKVETVAERRFEDNNLEALLKMLERVLAERSKETGRGIPRWRTWAPGDTVSSPDEINRYQDDELFGIDPLKRRCTRQRTKKEHLLAVFIDSSGSVSNRLFAQLYRVFSELAEKIAQARSIKLGVGQFSGGASWVLEPTDDTTAIEALGEEESKRLYEGSTVVGEIYTILADDFSGYKTADLIVLTDGYVEGGKVLAESLEAAHLQTGCEIRLHGVVFRKQGTLKQFKGAKDELPQFVRTWHLGGEE